MWDGIRNTLIFLFAVACWALLMVYITPGFWPFIPVAALGVYSFWWVRDRRREQTAIDWELAQMIAEHGRS